MFGAPAIDYGERQFTNTLQRLVSRPAQISGVPCHGDMAAILTRPLSSAYQ
jgi:hypothetical protein